MGWPPALAPLSSVSAVPPRTHPMGLAELPLACWRRTHPAPESLHPPGACSPSCCSSWKGLVNRHLSPGWRGDNDIGWLSRSSGPALEFPPQAWLAPPCLCPLPSDLSGPCSDPAPPVPTATAGPLMRPRCPAVRGTVQAGQELRPAVCSRGGCGFSCGLSSSQGQWSRQGSSETLSLRPSVPLSLRPSVPPQMERVRLWEARQLQNIEEATWHELTVEDDPPDTVPGTATAD